MGTAFKGREGGVLDARGGGANRLKKREDPKVCRIFYLERFCIHELAHRSLIGFLYVHGYKAFFGTRVFVVKSIAITTTPPPLHYLWDNWA